MKKILFHFLSILFLSVSFLSAHHTDEKGLLSFYANGTDYQNLALELFKTQTINFHADIEDISPDPQSLKWFIDTAEYLPAQDLLDWSITLAPGKYHIRMWVQFADLDTASISGVVNIAALISAVPEPLAYGTITGDGYYEVGEPITLTATPANSCYEFLHWTDESNTWISDDNPLSFVVEGDSSLVAHFELKTFDIVSSVTGGSGTIIPNGITTVNCGNNQAFTFTPDNCFELTSVSVDGLSVIPSEIGVLLGNTFTFNNITANHTLDVTFTRKTFEIIVLADPPTGGDVTGGNTNIACDSLLSIIATSNDCTVAFTHWTNGKGTVVSYEDTLTFTVRSDSTFIAHFTTKEFDVLATVNPMGSGTVSGNSTGLTCGTEVVLTATPEDCYGFIYWTNEDSTVVSNDNPYVVTLTSDTSLIAHFEWQLFNIVALTDPPDAGTFVGDGTDIPCGTDTIVTVTENTGFTFLYWTDENGNRLSDGFSIDTTVMENITLIAVFEADVFNIYVFSNPITGGMAGETALNVPYGQTKTVWASPFIGYDFINWTNKDSIEVSTLDTFTFKVTDSLTLFANFALKNFQITATPNPPSMGTTTGGGGYEIGTSATVIATPYPFCRFVNWTDENGFASNDSSYTFPVSRDRNLTANFARQDFSVKVLPMPGGQAWGGNDHIPFGTLVTVTASPNVGYVFENWTINGVPISVDTSYSFNVIESVIIVANFKPASYFNILVWASPGQGGTVIGDTINITYGSLHTVSAIPNSNYHFVNWTENGVEVSTSADYKFIVLRSRDLIANFAPNTYNVTLLANPPHGGTATGGGTNITHGTIIHALATANPFFTFVNWTTEAGTEVSTDANFNFTATSDTTFIAHFKTSAFNITVLADPDDGGIVDGGGNHIPLDSVITISAILDPCYEFINWTNQHDSIISTLLTFPLTVTSDSILTAHFKQKTFNISLIADPIGGGTVEGGGDFLCGNTATVTAIPVNACSRFVNWTDQHGTVVSIVPVFQLMVTSDSTLTANFVQETFNITLIADPVGSGTVNGGGNFLCGDTISIVAIPDECYDFINWTDPHGTVVSTDLEFQLIVTSDSALTANFVQKTFNINLIADPMGGGTVTGGGNFPCGNIATVTATPANNCTRFVNWTDQQGTVVSTNATFQFTVTNNDTLTAHFEQKLFSVTLLSDPPTAVTSFIGAGTNILCGTLRNIGMSFDNMHYAFVNWTDNAGNAISTAANFNITLLSDTVLIAHFTPKTYTVTVSEDPPVGGTATGGGTNIPYLDEITISATPSANYVFLYWSEYNIPVFFTPNATFKVTRHRDLVAHFELKKYTVTVLADPSEGGYVFGDGNQIEYDSVVTVTAKAFLCYTFVCWIDEDGYQVSTDSIYSFPVREDRILIAIFVKKSFSVTTSSNPPQGGTTSGSGNFPCEASVTVIATPNPNYRFVNWTDNGTEVSTNSTYTFPVSRNCNLTANFALKEFSVNVLAMPPTGGQASGSGNHIPFGTPITVTASPNVGYTFENWTIDGIPMSVDTAYTFNVIESVIVIANFKPVNYTISVWASPSASGTVTGDTINIPYGSWHTVSATPNPNYHFVNWTENGTVVSINADYEFIVRRSRDLVANFELNTYDITLLANPPYGGITTGGGPNIDHGTTIHALATANPFFTFINWTTENGTIVSTDPDFDFTAISDTIFIAHFKASTFNIAVLADPLDAGVVGGGGNDIPYYSEITISVIPDKCYEFISWTDQHDTVVSTELTFQLRVTGDSILTANFVKKTFDITLLAEPTAGGTVGNDFQDVDCEEEITISVIPDECYDFINWTDQHGTVVSTLPVFQLIATNDSVLTANFVQKTYNISLIVNPVEGGTINNNFNDAPCGDTISISVIPDECYEFINWTDQHGTEVSTLPTFQLTVTTDSILTANFVKKTFNITLIADPTAGGTVTPDFDDVVCGDTISISVIPDECYEFINWTDQNDSVVSATPEFQLIVTTDSVLTANFIQKTFNVTLSAAPADGGTVESEGDFLCGNEITVTAIPANDCYRFVNWTENGTTIAGAGNPYTFTLTEDRNLIAHFEQLSSSNITVKTNPTFGAGMAFGNDFNVPCGEERTVIAVPFTEYNFINWTDEDDLVVSTLDTFTFVVTKTTTLTANFELKSFHISTWPNTPDGGTTTGDGDYLSGETATVIATPYPLYRFVNWTDENGWVSNDNLYEFPVSRDRNLTANFEFIDFSVQVLPSPTSGGQVWGGGTHIPFGTLTTVIASPNFGYVFENWTINGIPKSVDTAYSFNVIESVTVIANFKPTSNIDITVWASPGEGGTVAGDTLNIPYGSWHTVYAYPNPNYHFVNWTENGDTVSPNAEYKFIVHYSRDLVANFARNTYDIVLLANPPHGGIITGSGTNIAHGTTIHASATENPFFTFIHWTTEDGTIVSTNPNFNFSAVSDTTLIAHFTSDTFTVTLTAEPTVGGVLTGGDSDIPYLTEITVHATPDSCYDFVCWMEAGDTVALTLDYTFFVTGNHNLVAHFSQKYFDVFAVANPIGGGVINPDTLNVACKDSITLIATPNLGYRFLNWTKDGAIVHEDSIYGFIVNDPIQLVANFEYLTYNIALAVEPFGTGTATQSGTYPLNYELTVHAIANPEYTFVCWTEGEDTVSTLADYPFIVNRDRLLIAHFADALFNVTVSPNFVYAGNVTGDTTGLSYGAWHTITATPNPYFVFVNWTHEEDGVWFSDSATASFPVHQTLNLVANFAPESCLITLGKNPTPGGEVQGGGVFPFGTVDTIKAFPASDFVFDRWTENDSTISNDSSYAFTVMTSRHIVAQFKPKGFNINVVALPGYMGDVSGGGVYQNGEIATVTAEAHSSYVFEYWTEDGDTLTGVPAVYQFPVTCSRNLTAHFRLESFNVVTSVNLPNGGECDGGGYNIPWGTNTVVIAYPYMNYDFVNWTENGDSVSGMAQYELTVRANHHFVANFKPKTYHINLDALPVSGGTVSGGGDYAYLESATIIATPNEGYVFVNWTENGDTLYGADAEYTFTVNHSRDLTANFAHATYNIILAAEPQEGGDVEGTEFGIPHGTKKTVLAIPKEYAYFVNWTEDEKPVSDDEAYTFTVTKSRYLVANFTTETHHITLTSIPPDGGTVTGDGDIPHGREHTITAIPNDCYEFVMWTEGDSVVSNEPDYTFTVEEDKIFMAHFRKTNVNIFTEANPPEGGTVEGEFMDMSCGTPVTIKAFPNNEYTFINWTRDGEVFATEAIYTFPAIGGDFVAHFAINEYTITLVADPPDLGTVTGSGTYNYGDTITVSAEPLSGFSLISWTENGSVVSTDVNYTFPVERSRTLVAHFEETSYTVIALSNDTVYGNVKGGGVYELNDLVEVKAYPNIGYMFANWTVNDVVVSHSPVYEFFVTGNVTIIANFYGLDFDTYAATLWDNTFMLNMNKLAKKGYDIIDCKWFKNGKEETNTHTIDAYSYSAGPLETDLLDLAPSYYMFMLITRDGTLMYSTKKMLTEYQFEHDPETYKMFVYPNPVISGAPFKLEGVTIGSTIEVYNQYGVCVSRKAVSNETETLSLNLPAGIYIIRNHYKTTRITVIK